MWEMRYMKEKANGVVGGKVGGSVIWFDLILPGLMEVGGNVVFYGFYDTTNARTDGRTDGRMI